ncbi:MAG: hypothetical protein ACR2H3_05440 [Acidimicrobiales bacterium]
MSDQRDPAFRGLTEQGYRVWCSVDLTTLEKWLESLRLRPVCDTAVHECVAQTTTWSPTHPAHAYDDAYDRLPPHSEESLRLELMSRDTVPVVWASEDGLTSVDAIGALSVGRLYAIVGTSQWRARYGGIHVWARGNGSWLPEGNPVAKFYEGFTVLYPPCNPCDPFEDDPQPDPKPETCYFTYTATECHTDDERA